MMIHRIKEENLEEHGLYKYDECVVVITKIVLKKGNYYDCVEFWSNNEIVNTKEFDRAKGENAKKYYDSIIARL